jgi:hypothetical protein
MNWYVVVARKRRGPLSTAQLVEELQAGRVPPDAWAWTEGMDVWVPAGEIPELRPRPVVQRIAPQPEPVQAPRASEKAPQTASPAKAKPRAAGNKAPQSWDPSAPALKQKFWDLLLRHWRGELSLPISFWVMSLGATVVVGFIGGIVDALHSADAPEPVAIATLALLAVASVIVIWQVVGVWRSAENYRARGGDKIWAQLAVGFTAVAAVRFVIGVVLVQAPIALEILRISDGPIDFGLTAKVDDALASFDHVRNPLEDFFVTEIPKEST